MPVDTKIYNKLNMNIKIKKLMINMIKINMSHHITITRDIYVSIAIDDSVT